jgi:glycosyltransferase involved in cell wall biosynthesis
LAPITFVCGTPVGGAVDSTVSLAAQARAAGHDVQLILATRSSYDRLPRVTAGIVRAEDIAKALGAAAWRVHDWASSHTRHDQDHGAERAIDVVAAARRLHRPGALLVVNSVRRLDLRRLLDLADGSGSHTVWYLREVASLAMAAELGPRVGTLVANSRPLADQAAGLSGRACHFVPSVIAREGLVEPELRETLLLVNPIPSHGLEVVLSVARVQPHRRIALQESWTLDRDARVELLRSTEDLANVEVRPRTDRSAIFHDARALLLPHSGDELATSRPRVALEAQHLGIPIVAHDIPGLAAVAASEELLVPEGAPVRAWVDALETLDAGYAGFSAAARELAAREMPHPEAIWAVFAEACSLRRG